MQAGIRNGIKHSSFPQGAFHPIGKMSVQLDNPDVEVPPVSCIEGGANQLSIISK